MALHHETYVQIYQQRHLKLHESHLQGQKLTTSKTWVQQPLDWEKYLDTVFVNKTCFLI